MFGREEMNWSGDFCGGRENVPVSCIMRVLLVLLIVRTDIF